MSSLARVVTSIEIKHKWWFDKYPHVHDEIHNFWLKNRLLNN